MVNLLNPFLFGGGPSIVRYYLAATVAAPASPAYQADWFLTTNAFRRKLLTAPTAADNSTVLGVNNNETSVTPVNLLTHQHVSDPIGSDRILAGTVDMVLTGREASGGADAFVKAILYVISGDLSTVRGVLADITDGLELNTAGTSRSRALSAILTPVSAQAGDYLVLEHGTRHTNLLTISLQSGMVCTAGITGLVDHDFVDEQDITGKRPWIELNLL